MIVERGKKSHKGPCSWWTIHHVFVRGKEKQRMACRLPGCRRTRTW